MTSWRTNVLRERGERPDGEHVTWRDECSALGRNACLLLRAAGKVVTAENVIRLIADSPTAETDLYSDEWQKRSLCVACLLLAYANSSPDAIALKEYFCFQLPRLRPSARQLLEDSFRGVLDGLDLELPFAEELDEPNGA